MIKEIIFDCFGVLSQDGWMAFYKKYAKPKMMDDLHAANELADKGIMSYQEFLQRVSDITGVDKAIVHKMITTSLHPNEEVFDFAKKLSKQYSLGIISNVGSPLEHYFPTGYLDIFTEQTLSFKVGSVKPSKEIFEIHLNNTGIEANEAVFIDDREVNCDGAKSAGLNAICFKNVNQLVAELSKLDVKINF
ncbi:HAD family phosphatase [Candidatus Nomurabacteria bacterium]|nr:HAD family phosphatase [Candidatus Nomurabacteria bacterium]